MKKSIRIYALLFIIIVVIAIMIFNNLSQRNYLPEKQSEINEPVLENMSWAFSEGLAHIRINSKYGYVDKKGSIVIKPQFEYAGNFSNNLASVRIDGTAGYIDTAGVLIIPPIYQWAGTFSEGLAGVKKDGKFGFIDNRGAVVFDFIYQEVRKFKNGRAFVRDSIEWKYLYIDEDYLK